MKWIKDQDLGAEQAAGQQGDTDLGTPRITGLLRPQTRAQGKKHNAAFICLARRRTDVIYAMLLREGSHYHTKNPLRGLTNTIGKLPQLLIRDWHKLRTARRALPEPVIESAREAWRLHAHRELGQHSLPHLNPQRLHAEVAGQHRCNKRGSAGCVVPLDLSV